MKNKEIATAGINGDKGKRKNVITGKMLLCMALFTLHTAFFTPIQAQDKIIYPEFSYAGSPKVYTIGGITMTGLEGYEDYMIIPISGLSVGQEVSLPGLDITDAVKRLWKQGMFSQVSITADSIVNNKIYLNLRLKGLPRISQINYLGMKKSEREDLEKKLPLAPGMQYHANRATQAKVWGKKYFEDKGFKNADIDVVQRDDPEHKGQIILDVIIDKKEKMRVRNIIIDGNSALPDKKIKGGLFRKGAFAKTHEAGKLSTFLKSKKFTPERWKEDKRKLIAKYNELGYRDATIVEDSVWNNDYKHVNIYVKVNEGRKYYLRNITWVGNTVYPTNRTGAAPGLNDILNMKKGDVYDQTKLNKRLHEDDDAVANNYYNNGYVFSQVTPVDLNVVGDSIDLEIRIVENQQAHLNHIRINGNDRLYENVIRRELTTKPGDLFSKESLMRTARELASTGHFDPESVSPDTQLDYENGTVDINWNLEQKSNDQIEFSLGWGQTGVIGRVGLKLNNFSMRNLFNKNREHRGIMPIGDGEVLGLNFQTNGTYYRSYNASYSTGWFGGKRPIQFSVGTYYSKQSDVSSNYYNSAWRNNYYNYMYGYGSYYNPYGYGGYGGYYNNYESYYDPDKYVKLMGASLGWGTRLRWPDDYFQLYVQLAFTRYMLKNWQYFLLTTGNSNNLNLSLQLSRTSTDNPLFPRRGSEFMASVTVTPPWSKWDGKDYQNLATDSRSASYNAEQQEKFKWIEYHKWKFKARTFTALSSAPKTFVLMTRVELGLLGSYNKYKKSPFETFYVGGDGMSGYSTGYAEETIGLRGYDNGSLTPWGYEGYAYDRFTLELRYPFLLGNTTIYGLGFLEGGNAWNDTKNFNPFELKRSAGAGVRIYLPMVGLMGIDWAYGFDKVFGNKGGSQFHFVLGQEF